MCGWGDRSLLREPPRGSDPKMRNRHLRTLTGSLFRVRTRSTGGWSYNGQQSGGFQTGMTAHRSPPNAADLSVRGKSATFCRFWGDFRSFSQVGMPVAIVEKRGQEIPLITIIERKDFK